MSINEILSIPAQTLSCGHAGMAGSGVMLWKFIRRFWDGGGSSAMMLKPGESSDSTQPHGSSGDLSLAGLTPAERRRKTHDRQLELEEHRRADEKQSRDSREDTELRLRLQVLAEAHRQAIKQLSSDIDDAIAATRLALKRAGETEVAARQTLENLQSEAMVVDGARVYFSKSGTLYGEDRRELTGKTMDEARLVHSQRIRTPSFEDYKQAFDNCRDAETRAERLAEILDRLDELKEQTASGSLSPEQLAVSRKELERVVSGLPADAREDYERLRSSRAREKDVGYKSAPDGFISAPSLNVHFVNAQHPAPETDAQTPSDPAQGRKPLAYKTVPDA